MKAFIGALYFQIAGEICNVLLRISGKNGFREELNNWVKIWLVISDKYIGY